MQLSRTLLLSLLPFAVQGAFILAEIERGSQEQASSGLVMAPMALDGWKDGPLGATSHLAVTKLDQILDQKLATIHSIDAIGQVMQSLESDIKGVYRVTDSLKSTPVLALPLSLYKSFNRANFLLHAQLTGSQSYEQVIDAMNLFVEQTRSLSELLERLEVDSSVSYQQSFKIAHKQINHILNAHLGASKSVTAIHSIMQKFETVFERLKEVAKKVKVELN